MKFYIGVNQDGTEMLSKMPLKRFFSLEQNKNEILSFEDTKMPPHWIVDYGETEISRLGHSPIDEFLTLPAGAVKRMFNVDLTWDDDCLTINL